MKTYSKEAYRQLAILIESSPGTRRIGDGLQNIYLEVFSRYDDEILKVAVGKVIRSKMDNFIPPVGVIVAKIEGTEKERVVVSASSACELVFRQAASRGRDDKPVFDQVTEAAVRAIGWQRICNSNPENHNWLKKEFIQEFENYSSVAGQKLLEPSREEARQILSDLNIQRTIGDPPF